MKVGIGVAAVVGLAALVAALIGGCQGNVQTKVLRSQALLPDSTLEGLIFHLPQFVKVTHSFTTRVTEAGQVTGKSADGTCEPVVEREEVTVMPDLGRPMLISNSSGIMSSAKFSVTLDKGMLVSVNAEPTQKTSEVLAAVAPKGILPMRAAVIHPPQERPACNVGPQVSSFEKIALP